MWKEIIIALLSALVGTYFGTFFLSKREESKMKKVRNIALRAIKIIHGYAKSSGTYDMANAELNAKLNIAEKRAVIVALHKLGLPIQTPVNAPFDIKDIKLNNEMIDKDFLEDAKVQIEHGHCDHLYYEDPEKYFSENLRTSSLRSLAKRFVDEILSHSTYKKSDETIYYPDSWASNYSWGEKKAIGVFKCQITNSIYFHSDGTPDPDKLEKLKTEVDAGLWDNYLFWTFEAYDNLSLGTNLASQILQNTIPQQNASASPCLSSKNNMN